MVYRTTSLKAPFALVLILFMMLFSACQKCRTCQCWSNGIAETSEMCVNSMGVSKATKILDDWEQNLKSTNLCDSVKCGSY